MSKLDEQIFQPVPAELYYLLAPNMHTPIV